MEDRIMTLEEFVFDLPLYKEVGHDDGYDEIVKLIENSNEDVVIEGYNAERGRDSTFSLERGLGDVRGCYYNNNSMYGSHLSDNYDFFPSLVECNGVKLLVFRCKRYGDDVSILVWHNFEKCTLMKVGQCPSIADIHIGKVKQYNKVLEKPILKEFTKAIGLAANGVGIGSFVYLRRIFENLVMDAYNEALQAGIVDAETFEKQRMDEKIKSLNGYLPPFIVENHGIYSILSKGIHELSEDECLAYFDCMRQSIELILDERLEQIAKKKKQEEVKKAINSIVSKIKK